MTLSFPRLAVFRALGQRPFALLWGGQTISRVGDFLYQVALAWWVLEKTGSAVSMGAVLVFSMAPTVVFTLLGGVAVDRFPRFQVMFASDIGRGVVVSLVAALALTQRLEIWHVYLAGALFGLADAFFQPAYTAAVPDITPADDLPSANALTSLSLQGGRVVGPAIGAGLVALGGSGLAFALNGLSFFLSAVCLVPLLKVQAARGETGPSGSLMGALREGLTTVLGLPWLWVGMLVFAVTNVTLVGPFNVALPFLVKDGLGQGVQFLGLLYAMFPLGAVLGAVWAGQQTRLPHRGWSLYLGVIVGGLGILALGLPLPLAALLLVAVVNGAALEVTIQTWTHSLQEMVPGDRLGRVASIDNVGSFALLPLGYALTGWATDALGPALVCLIGGGLTMIVAALGLLHPQVRQLD